MYNKNQKIQEDGQLDIQLNVKKDNTVAFFKHAVDKQIMTATVIPYWRNFPFVFAFVFQWMLFIFFGIALYFLYSKLPVQIPLFYSQALSSWELINKEILFVIMGFLFLFNCAFPLLNSKIFNFDKRFVLISNISIIILYCLLLFAFTEIFSLLLR